jgi:serine/threonine protein kinase
MSGIPGTQARANENFIGRLLRNGEYRVEKILGQGGMGRVFLVSHTILQVPFAVKQGITDQPVPEAVRAELERLLHTELLLRRTAKQKLTEQDFPLSGGVHTDRFLREALLLARLQHSSLPLLYDYFIEDGYWYLVMDYIPGPTLSAYMHKHAPLPPLEALNYAIQLCDVLDYLHKQRPPVVFRDLKPSNILLSPDGRVMLVDFGIARYFKEGQNNDTTEFGSPGYAPPEQYKGGAQTDARSDLFSLGVILHEMLSGKRPSGMNSALESLSQLNPAISAVLSGLVTVATRAEPLYRFQSAHAFYQALERAYRIEERRAYSRTLHEAETGGTPEELSLHVFAPLPGEKEMDIFQPTVDMQQRQQTREALQEVRREKFELEQVERQLDSIDANLSIRSSSMGLTPLPLPPTATAASVQSEETEEFPLPPPRSRYPLRRVFSVLIGLLLILVLVVASVNIYAFFSHSHSSLIQPPQTFTTATTTTTPTGTWQVLPSLPSAEADNAATYVQIGGRAYIYMNGGFRGPKLTPHYDRNLYRYDVAAAHWEMLTVQNFPGMVNNAVALDEAHIPHLQKEK